MSGRVAVCERKARTPKAKGPKIYTFVDRLPSGVTPEEARERVIAALGGCLTEGAK